MSVPRMALALSAKANIVSAPIIWLLLGSAHKLILVYAKDRTVQHRLVWTHKEQCETPPRPLKCTLEILLLTQ